MRDLPVDAAFSVAPGPAKALIEVVSMDPKGLGSVPREYLSWFALWRAAAAGYGASRRRSLLRPWCSSPVGSGYPASSVRPGRGGARRCPRRDACFWF